MQTNDRPISELMKDVHTGKAQLPDFQRGWVWDDNRIRALIASITSNFPIGAAMFLEYGNENIRFKYLNRNIQKLCIGNYPLIVFFVISGIHHKKNHLEVFPSVTL